MPTVRRIENMTRVLKYRQPDLTVVCENVHDPHNVSAILRSCDAVGIEKIYLFYTRFEFPKIGKKSSASAKKWINFQSFTDNIDLQKTLKEQGFTIYATHLNKNSVSIYDVDWTKPSAIIVGNEHSGVSDEAYSIADQTICIPMLGMVKSLNVSVATAVILYEACRQRLIKGLYPYPYLTHKRLTTMLKKWKEK